MLPVFPNFKNLEISDKEDIEYITHQFPPYSDFNFVSLWAWNTQGKIEISQLNNNLVVKFQDYLDNNYFYSFIGMHDVLTSIEKLLSASKAKGFGEELKLIPENNFDQETLQTAREK